ncbi:hypothetical protein E2562_013113 [Oryza meyeriana var. granulata]|uniref:Uncharacterized protein n=1 Tax=Oryza meyeriana var. granulata TaxID=110450 RepID=A0A6G1F7T0_9ORYZ|nr:hypothetical protein E2562_013113 [Oryza meyeriana var. granulata]
MLGPAGKRAAQPGTEVVWGGKVSLRDGLDSALDSSGNGRGWCKSSYAAERGDATGQASEDDLSAIHRPTCTCR